MKKFFLGVLIGASVATTGSVYADEIATIVGKQIEGSFTVKVNGVQLAAPAAVVEGTSYLPVRAIGEALNMEVKFDSALGIQLEQKGAAAPVTNVQQPPKPTLADIQKKIDAENENITHMKGMIEHYQKLVNDPQMPVPSAQKFIDMYKQSLLDAEARIAELDKQKAELSK